MTPNDYRLAKAHLEHVQEKAMRLMQDFSRRRRNQRETGGDDSATACFPSELRTALFEWNDARVAVTRLWEVLSPQQQAAIQKEFSLLQYFKRNEQN